MSDPSGWITRVVIDGDIPTPAAGKIHVYWVASGARYKGNDGIAHDFPSVASFNGRTGAVVPAQADYDSFFLTSAEGDALYDALGAAAASTSAHAAAGDPHTGYQRESEKDQASGYAGLSAGSKLAGAQQTYGTSANTATEGNDTRVVNAVQTSRTVSTTAPLTGGGALSSNLTLALTTSPVSQTPVGVTRSIATTTPLGGGGDLSADRTLTISAATTGAAGSMSAADKTKLDGLTDATLTLAAPGTSVTATVQQHFNINLNRCVYNLLNYIGSQNFVEDDGSGSVGTDVGAAMNTIFGLLTTAKGGRIILPRAMMRVVTPMVCNGSGIEIDGPGCGYNSDTGGTYEGLGAAFVSRMSAGNILLDVFPAGTSGVGQNLKGFRMSGVTLDGRGNTTGTGDVGSIRADKGLRLRSCSGFHIEDIYVRDCVTSHIELDVLAPGTIGEAHDCTRGVLNRICIRALDNGGAAGAVPPGVGLVMNGSASANTCYNRITALQILYQGSNTGKPGIDMVNTDSNKFDTVNIYNASGAATSNWGCVVRGGASAVASSRSNTFENFSPGTNGLILCGTALGIRPDLTADAAFNFTAAASNNRINLNTENGEPYVYRGTGVRGPLPGAFGGSTFATQGFVMGGGVLASQGVSAAVTGAKTTILGVTVPKWFFTDGTTIEVMCEGFWSWGAAIATFTMTLDVGGVNVASCVLTTTATARTAEPMGFSAIATCTAAGAAGSMRGGLTPRFSTVDAAGGAVTTAAAITGTGAVAGAVNTTIANAINVTIACTGTTPSFTPLSTMIRVIN